MDPEKKAGFAIWAGSGLILGTAIVLRILDDRTAAPIGEDPALIKTSDSQPEFQVTKEVGSELLKDKSPDKPVFNQQLDGAMAYLDNSDIPLLQSYKTLLDFHQQKGNLVIFPVPPDGSLNQGFGDKPQAIDLFFKNEEGKGVIYLVFNPIETRDQGITPEELAIGLAQKALVVSGLMPGLEHYGAYDLKGTLIELEPVRNGLEAQSWRAIVEQVLIPLSERGLLGSDSLLQRAEAYQIGQ